MEVIVDPFIVDGWLEVAKTKRVKDGKPFYVITEDGYIVDVVKSGNKITVRRYTSNQPKETGYTLYSETIIRKPFFKDFSQSCFDLIVSDVGEAKWVIIGEISAHKLPSQARCYIIGKEQRAWVVPLFRDSRSLPFIPTPFGPIPLSGVIHGGADLLPSRMTKRLASLVNNLLVSSTDWKIEEDKNYRVTENSLFVREALTDDIRRRIMTSQHLVDCLNKTILAEQEALSELQKRHDKSMRVLP